MLFVDFLVAEYIFIARIWVKYQRSQCSGSLFFPNTAARSLHPKAWIRLPNICTEYKRWCRMSTHMKLLFLASLHLCFLYLFFTNIIFFISSRGLQVKIWNYHQTLKEMILRYWLRTVFFKPLGKSTPSDGSTSLIQVCYHNEIHLNRNSVDENIKPDHYIQ